MAQPVAVLWWLSPPNKLPVYFIGVGEALMIWNLAADDFAQAITGAGE